MLDRESMWALVYSSLSCNKYNKSDIKEYSWRVTCLASATADGETDRQTDRLSQLSLYEIQTHNTCAWLLDIAAGKKLHTVGIPAIAAGIFFLFRLVQCLLLKNL